MRAEDKRIINGQTDVNQLVPFKYKWAWDKYLSQCANHWMPQEVNMQRDIEQWKSGHITPEEMHIVKRNLGFFTTADSLAANNIVLGTYRHITAPECRQFLLRQAFEECYIAGTEVLTNRGFIDFSELRDNDLVAQYHDGGGIDFVEPLKKIINFYSGRVYKFSNGRKIINQVVTPGHRMPYIKEGALGFKDAEDATYTRSEFPVSGFSIIDGPEITDFERFLVAFQADGSLNGRYNGSRCGTVPTMFTFTKERKIARFESLVERLGFRYLKSPMDNRGRYTYRVSVPVGYKLSKTFDWVGPVVSQKWAEEFLDELSRWDGSNVPNSDGVILYSSKFKSNVDAVQAISAICGRSTVYSVREDGRSENYSDMHKVTITKRTASCRGTVKKEELDYEGNVYCVTVPSGAIVIRHKNSVSIGGNCIHTHSYQYIVESLGLDESEIFGAYQEIPSIKNKDDFLIPFINVLTDPNFKTGTTAADQTLLKSLVVFACIMEGLFFYVGFAQILALGRQNKMTGAAEQYQYILRDESAHCNFGIDMINTIKLENPHLWTEQFKSELNQLFIKAVDLEYAYAEDTMPRGVLGLNVEGFKGYLRFIANRRMEQIGLTQLFPGAENTFSWMSEMIDLRKEKNFFETRVTEYQTGGALSWD